MTLLGAVRDDDAVLVTADSNVWRTDGQGGASFEGTTVKFHRLREDSRQGGYLLYGFYGSEHIGEPLGAQLEASSAWAKWDELLRVAGDMFRRANTAPGMTQDHFTSCLFAGCLMGEFGIQRLNYWGRQEAQEDPAFLGNGRIVAKAGWQVAAEIDSAMSAEDRLRLVMRHTVNEVQPLGPPINFWRVTCDGVEDLRPEIRDVEVRWRT